MLAIERLSPSDESAVVQVLRIYQASIEPSEQKTVAQVTGLIEDPRYHVLVARDGVEVAGFAMGFLASQFVLLEYMAVDRSLRSRKIGAALLDAASDVAAARDAPLLLEVDQPGTPASPESDAVRRLRFYADGGCRRIVGLDYMLPLTTNGIPPPMWLLTRGRTLALSYEEMREWLTVLYVDVYGQDARDPRIDAMMASAGCQEFILSGVR